MSKLKNCLKNNRIYLVILSIAFGFFTHVNCEDDTVSALIGESATLKCPVDISACGELHSVKWYKGSEDIAVVSGDGEYARITGDTSGRFSIDHSPAGPLTRLQITKAEVSDEESYSCETTYVEPLETCSNLGVYSIYFSVLVPPKKIHMLNETGGVIVNSTKLGPLREGDTLNVVCEVQETRPAPTHIGWYRAGKRLSDSQTMDQANGLFTVKSQLSLVLSRKELGTFIECRVESPALDNKIVSNQLELDMHVRPTNISISGVKHHAVQGTKVLLQCQVMGARPQVDITWFNRTEELNPETGEHSIYTISTKHFPKNDGTFETISHLIFTASRFENERKFECKAENIVTRVDSKKPLHDFLILEVMYPPVVTVQPENITVNETANILLLCNYLANPNTIQTVKWYKNGLPLSMDDPRFEGAKPNQTALVINNSSRNDIGNYTCELSNSIGKEISENEIAVDVYFVPIVRLLMSPDIPIVEDDGTNVTLTCNVEEGNPSELLRVRWLMDGDILKELPQCDPDDDDESDIKRPFCDVESDKVMLVNVDRKLWGNYSCRGYNMAGWGKESEAAELMVYYEPGNATITHEPAIPVKRKYVSFKCHVDDGGNPNATRYRWLKNGEPVPNVVTNRWTVEEVKLDTRTNISCFAYNEGGNGVAASVELDVHAAPAFIKPLPPYSGALFSTPGISLTCHVECVPTCTIDWFKDGEGIDDETNDYYQIVSTNLSANPKTNDFESVLSILHFNMSAWPDQKLDIFRDSSNYSCVSSNNSVGPGVRSATYLAVEFPPENTTTTKMIEIEEGDDKSQTITCSSKASPLPSYEWRRNDSVIGKGHILILDKLNRTSAGEYVCVAFNKHGTSADSLFVNITYKPDCTITRKDIDDEDTLICTADGNPSVFDFHWEVENGTIDEDKVKSTDELSMLTLDEDMTEMQIYSCVSNNTVGWGTVCTFNAAVRPQRSGGLFWWQKLGLPWGKTTIIIVLAVLAFLLLLVIIICIIIICVCRKRRRQEKYHTDITISSTQSALSQSHCQMIPNVLPQQPLVPEIPKSPPKWPLRPGVLVHVKVDTKQNLCASRGTTTDLSDIEQLSSISGGVVTTPKTNTTPTVSGGASSGGGGVGDGVTSTNNNNTIINNNEDNKVNAPELCLRDHHDGNVSSTNHNNDDDDNDGGGGDDDGDGDITACTTNADELINFTNSNFIERILNRLRWRREKGRRRRQRGDEKSHQSTTTTTAGGDGNCGGGAGACTSGGNFLTRSNRNAVSILRSAGLRFGSGKSTTSATGLFDDKHQHKHEFSGIQCTSDVVTYKRTPVMIRPVIGEVNPFVTQHRTNAKTVMATTQTEMITTNNNNKNRRTQNFIGIHHDKSSVAGDPLTEPGEYENLPFHGLQSAPNKLNFNTNLNSNVVRVAPRPKNPTYQFNIANSNHLNNNHKFNLYPKSSQSSTSQPLSDSIRIPTSNCNFLNYTNYLSGSNHDKMNGIVGGGGLCGLPPPGESIGGEYLPPPTSKNPFNPFLVKNLQNCDNQAAATVAVNGKGKANSDKKYNSLKSLGIKKSPQFYSMRLNKCRRHQSMNGQGAGGGKGMQHAPPPYTTEQQPVYENLTDSIQIAESVYEPYEQERTSIYRSDSGISNSSYECITPVPAPRTKQRKCQSAPVYMNLPNSGGPKNGYYYYNYRQHNAKCKESGGGGGGSLATDRSTALGVHNFEETGANMYVQKASSAHHRRHQHHPHVLMPKELFPNNTSNDNMHNNQQNSSSSTSSNGGNNNINNHRRPVKLPLRKHHTFHFQTSQTTAAVVKQKKSSKFTNGPLIFKPFTSEKSAFKPITPVPKSPNRVNDPNVSFYTPPRICGTSLKRHMSNVETSNCYRDNNSAHSSRENDDRETMTPRHIINRSGGRGIPGNSNCYSDGNGGAGESDGGDGVCSGTNSEGGKAAHILKRLVYADLAPLNSSSSGNEDKSVDEQIRLKNFTSDNLPSNSSNNFNSSSSSSNGGRPSSSSATHYTTIKFNEVNI